MAILTYPLNGVLYDAEDAETYLCTRTSGVFASDGHFPASVTGSREITIGPGLAWMQNEEFHGKAIYNPENVTLEIAEADAYQTRIDRIVLRFDKLLNKTDLMILEGTPSSNPQPPAITRDSLTYDLGLYTVTVKNSTVSLSEADVASTMLDESVCGIMEDAVTSIPTQELYDQWYSWFADIQTDTEAFEDQFNIWFQEIKDQAETYMKENEQEFEDWRDEQQKDFDEWFDNLEYVLDGDVAGKLEVEVENAQDTADTALEQLASGWVEGFMTDNADGSGNALQAEDDDDNYAITLSRPICNCDEMEDTASGLVSDEFATNKTYSAGDYCIYNNILYKFTADKSEGAWDYSVVESTKIADEVASNSADIASNTSNIATVTAGLTDGSVTKVGTSTVGSGTRPMYLSSGTPTASSSTVGSSSNPVYLNSGTITACNMSSVFRVNVVSTDNVTISASSNYSYSVNASLSGYTPQAVIGYSISNASSSGTMSSWCNVFGYWLTNNTAYANIRNTSTSTDAKVQIQLWILYGAS